MAKTVNRQMSKPALAVKCLRHTKLTESLTEVKWWCLETFLLIYHKNIHLCPSPITSSHRQEFNARCGNKGEVMNALVIGLTGLFKYGLICTFL